MLIIGAVILTAITIGLIVLPLTQTDMSQEEPPKIDFTLAELEEEKESSYFAIKEAEFDYKIGKLSDEDFEIVKNQYSRKAVETCWTTPTTSPPTKAPYIFPILPSIVAAKRGNKKVQPMPGFS